jgi:hypothetical protein
MMRATNRFILVAIWACWASNLAGAAESGSAQAVRQLREWLQQPASERRNLQIAPFANVPLIKADAAIARQLLWEERLKILRLVKNRLPVVATIDNVINETIVDRTQWARHA